MQIKPEAYTPEGAVAVVVAQFNSDITDVLKTSAVNTLKEAGCTQIDCVEVPGAFEIPLVAQHLAETDKYSGIVVLGCVIRGETAHFDYVAGECARGVQQVALEFEIPIGFGVLTTETHEQARVRADGSHREKGRDAAMAMLNTLSVFEQLHGVET